MKRRCLSVPYTLCPFITYQNTQRFLDSKYESFTFIIMVLLQRSSRCSIKVSEQKMTNMECKTVLWNPPKVICLFIQVSIKGGEGKLWTCVRIVRHTIIHEWETFCTVRTDVILSLRVLHYLILPKTVFWSHSAASISLSAHEWCHCQTMCGSAKLPQVDQMKNT